MGMGGGGGGSSKVKSDINVTPLVDVVLVLLIIFLVTMPILMKDITIDIPRKSDQDVPADIMPDQVTIEMKAGGQLFMSGQAINRTELAEKLRDRLDRMREKIVFVDFDDATRYGDAVQIMDVCKGAGASKVGLKMRDENAGQPGAPGAPAAPAAPTPPATP